MKNVLLVLILLSLINITACHKKDLQPLNNPFLRADKSTLIEMAAAISDTIVINSSMDWTLSLPSWVHAASTSGSSGTTTLILNVDANGGTDIRNAVIVISTSAQSTIPNVTIKISQGGSAPFLLANRYVLSEDSTGQQDSIIITSNTNWSLSIPASAAGWISADKQSGVPGSSKVFFTISSNTNSTLQSADVSITSSNSNVLPLKVTIYQVVNYHIQTITPNGGLPGDTVMLKGKFGPNPIISLKGINIPLIYSDSATIQFIIGSALPMGQLVVSFGNTILTSPGNFIPYSISNYTDHGQIGDQILINGSFPSNASVAFNGVVSSNVSVNNLNSTIQCTVPAGATSGPIQIIMGKDTLTTSSGFTVTNVWLQRSQNPGTLNISGGISFVNNGTIYWGLGLSGNTYNTNFYTLDASFSWNTGPSIASSMPGRKLASVYVLNSILYMGLGTNGSGNLSDWWQFDPLQNGNAAWTQMPDYPTAVSGSIAFASNGLGYVGFGSTGNAINSTIYRFDYSNTPIWTNVGGGGSDAANRSCFTIGNTAYYGGGINALNGSIQDFYSFDPSTLIITTQQSIPSTTISSANEIAPSFSYNNKGYIISHFNQLFEYDVSSNTWTDLGTTPTINYITVNGTKIYGWDNTGKVYEYIANY